MKEQGTRGNIQNPSTKIQSSKNKKQEKTMGNMQLTKGKKKMKFVNDR
jgi:hypothetical protein